MLKRWISLLTVAVTISILAPLSTAARTTRIDREIRMAAAWAAKYHVPLTCNELGTFRKFALATDRAVWIRDMRTALEKHNIGWTMWDYAGGFAVVNKQNGRATPDDEVVKALGLGGKK